jgi:hypothetical protein
MCGYYSVIHFAMQSRAPGASRPRCKQELFVTARDSELGYPVFFHERHCQTPDLTAILAIKNFEEL